jgi:flavodoxin
MENKTIIIYQSGAKTGNTKYIAEEIAKELNCETLDVSTNPQINLEQYNIVGFGSGVYFLSVGHKLKK